MGYPGVDYNELAQKAIPALGQYTQGVDPNWTALASAYGFIQNPFPAAGTEGQDQMRYLATLKNIMDAQLGGPNGRYSQMSPNNPIAAMPFGMRQWMSGAANLLNSPQGRNLMPLDQADMFGGGYQYGPINTGTESGLQQFLRTARGGGPAGQTQYPGAANTSVSPGAIPMQAPAEQAALPAGGGTPTTPMEAAQVQGGNDTASMPPSAANTTQTSGTVDIASALATLDKERTAAAQNSAKNAPPPLQRAFEAFQNYREGNAQSSKSKELDFWTNPVFQDFANWVSSNLQKK